MLEGEIPIFSYLCVNNNADRLFKSQSIKYKKLQFSIFRN